MSTDSFPIIRRRFIGAIVTVLTVLTGLFAWYSLRDYESTIAGAQLRSASYASALKEHAERVFAQADGTLQDLVGEIQKNGGLPSTQGELFYRRLSLEQKSGSKFSSIYVVDKHGDIRAHSQQFGMKPVNLADRDYFVYHRNNPSGGLFISKPFTSRVSGTKRFSLSRALKDGNGQFNGLVSVTFEVSYFQTFYKSIDMGKNGRIILATVGGDILLIEPAFEQPFARDFKSSIVFAKYLPASPLGTHQVLSPLTNTMRIMSYHRLETIPLVAIVSFDKTEVVSIWRTALYKHGVVALLLVIFVVVLSLLFLRQLRRLEQATRHLELQQNDIADKAGKLLTAAKEWRGTFDAVADAVWVMDRQRQIVQANNACQILFGKSPLEIVGQHCSEMVYENVLHREDCPFEAMLITGERATAQFVRDHRWYEVSVDPIIDANGAITKAVFVVKDISTLKNAELREHVRSEVLERIASGTSLSELLVFIVEIVERELPGALCSIMLVDEDGKCLVNGAAPSLPEFYNRAVNRTRIGEGIGSCGTAAFRRERVVVEDIDTHPFWKGFTPAKEAGLKSCWSEPIIAPDGQLLGTFAIYHCQPALPGDEEIGLIKEAANFACIALERNRAEAQRTELELQLGQSQKMEAIGHLAGGVAHDFNNLLTPIIVYADLLKRALSGDEKLLPKIDGIVKASHKARDLTQQLLGFGRKQVLQMSIVDLNEAITSFHSIMRRALRESVEIKLQLSTFPAIIRADRSKIDQIILNLAINAQDAITDTGEILVETGQVIIDDEYARLHPGMDTGRYVLLAFKDTGKGMSDDVLRHIFEPFYTTKQIGHGTGLGLANVYGTVKQHKGYISVQSKVGSGTTFRIYFPMVEELPESPGQDTEVAGGVLSGTETILLVEDNEMVRDMVAELLVDVGYRVQSADHPAKALDLIRQHPEKIDLLLTDVVMPGMNGLQLFEQINAERPDIDRVLYMSGYTNNVIVTSGLLEEETHFLQKPFTSDVLLTKIRKILSSEVIRLES